MMMPLRGTGGAEQVCGPPEECSPGPHNLAGVLQRADQGLELPAPARPTRGLSHENWSPPKRVPPERPRQKNWSPGTSAAEKSVRWGPSVAPRMVRPCCRWSPVLKRPRQKNWSPRNIRGRKIGPLGTVRGTAHGPPLLSIVPRPKSVSSALPGFVYQVGALSCSLGRYWLIARCPALRGCIFTLANIHHKTMHNPNLSTLNYLFLYIHHETNCDMNHTESSFLPLVDGICKIS